MVMNDGGVTPSCCGEEMEVLEAGTTDAATEKHVPVVEQNSGKVIVKVGEVPHPMEAAHLIKWICLTDGTNSTVHKFAPNDEPKADFALGDLDPTKLTAFAYCNLHGLWQS